MKKIVSFLIILVGVLGLLTPLLAAPNINQYTSGVAGKAGYDTKGVTDTTLSQTVGKIIKVVLSIAGTIFFVLTFYAGFLWMTASGNDEQVTKATGILKMAVIGLIICLASYSITYFVMNATAGSISKAPVLGK